METMRSNEDGFQASCENATDDGGGYWPRQPIPIQAEMYDLNAGMMLYGDLKSFVGLFLMFNGHGDNQHDEIDGTSLYLSHALFSRCVPALCGAQARNVKTGRGP